MSFLYSVQSPLPKIAAGGVEVYLQQTKPVIQLLAWVPSLVEDSRANVCFHWLLCCGICWTSSLPVPRVSLFRFSYEACLLLLLFYYYSFAVTEDESFYHWPFGQPSRLLGFEPTLGLMTRCLLVITFAFFVTLFFASSLSRWRVCLFSSIVFLFLFHCSIPLNFILCLSQAG